jgi:lysophospholipase L1-like esterase
LLNSFVLNTLKLFSWPAVPYTIGADVTTELVIPDGFYKASSYVAKIKELIAPYSMDITLDNLTNKVSITHSLVDNIKYPFTDPNGRIVLQLPSHNTRDNIGINNETNVLVINTPLVGDTNIDLVNYKKVIIATDLDFTNKTHNDLIRGNDDATGIGNIIAWIDSDLPPFTCVKYNNYEMTSYRIENKNISNIRFTIYNEKRQKLNINNLLLHFEIEKLRLN